MTLFSDPCVVRPPMAGRYVTLMADPPWLEQGAGQTKRGADRHYPLMTTWEIATLPVRDWMQPDSHLYLWVTNNFLEDGLAVMKAWGYEYKTIITWMKDRMGIGQYFRGITEHCLFGVRGNIAYRLTDDGHRLQGLTGFFEAPRTEHSAKPQQMRDMIERVSPGPYLEMFARQPVDGWDVWGNESSGERLSA